MYDPETFHALKNLAADARRLLLQEEQIETMQARMFMQPTRISSFDRTPPDDYKGVALAAGVSPYATTEQLHQLGQHFKGFLKAVPYTKKQSAIVFVSTLLFFKEKKDAKRAARAACRMRVNSMPIVVTIPDSRCVKTILKGVKSKSMSSSEWKIRSGKDKRKHEDSSSSDTESSTDSDSDSSSSSSDEEKTTKRKKGKKKEKGKENDGPDQKEAMSIDVGMVSDPAVADMYDRLNKSTDARLAKQDDTIDAMKRDIADTKASITNLAGKFDTHVQELPHVLSQATSGLLSQIQLMMKSRDGYSSTSTASQDQDTDLDVHDSISLCDLEATPRTEPQRLTMSGIPGDSVLPTNPISIPSFSQYDRVTISAQTINSDVDDDSTLYGIVLGPALQASREAYYVKLITTRATIESISKKTLTIEDSDVVVKSNALTLIGKNISNAELWKLVSAQKLTKKLREGQSSGPARRSLSARSLASMPY